MRAIQIEKTGEPEALRLADVAEPDPASREEDCVVVEVHSAGVNYIDTYYRTGLYYAQTPFVPGLEGAGRVIHDPQGDIAEGTMVAWAHAFGSYAEQVLVERDKLVFVPEEIDTDVAASMLIQGMTAHYLTNGVYDLSEGDSCLVTAGAGGVGRLVTQMAKAKGATVYSVVSTPEKEELAYAAGADQVFGYSEGLAESVRRHNGGRGVDVVYDGVGKTTFQESLEVTRPRGTVCLFGAASGPVDPIDPQELNKHGALFLTRPSLAAWTANEGEFHMRAQAVVRGVLDGELDFRVSEAYPLADAAQAHRDLEARKTTGAIVLHVKDD